MFLYLLIAPPYSNSYPKSPALKKSTQASYKAAKPKRGIFNYLIYSQ